MCFKFHTGALQSKVVTVSISNTWSHCLKLSTNRKAELVLQPNSNLVLQENFEYGL